MSLRAQQQWFDKIMAAPIDPLLWKGKRASEMLREELIECALFFQARHIEAFEHRQKLTWRIGKLELGLSVEDIAKVDWWIAHHPPFDTEHPSTGKNLYADWREFKRGGDGYQLKAEVSQRRSPARHPKPARAKFEDDIFD
jgi:hypothetical protein